MDLGVDIVEIKRIGKQVRNPRFLKRVYADAEVRYCKSRKQSAQHFAVRFAAKEAVWKAVSSSLGKRTLSHRDIQVQNAPNGKPRVILPKAFASLEKALSLSLSHGREYAVAVALLQSK